MVCTTSLKQKAGSRERARAALPSSNHVDQELRVRCERHCTSKRGLGDIYCWADPESQGVNFRLVDPGILMTQGRILSRLAQILDTAASKELWYYGLRQERIFRRCERVR